jgi:hypothetical protein
MTTNVEQRKRLRIENTFKINLTSLRLQGVFDEQPDGFLVFQKEVNTEIALAYKFSDHELHPSITLNYSVKHRRRQDNRNAVIRLERKACNLGGERFWWRCFGCGKRSHIQLLTHDGEIGCRKCLNVSYPSQHYSGWSRWEGLLKPRRKIERALKELSWSRSPERRRKAMEALKKARQELSVNLAWYRG